MIYPIVKYGNPVLDKVAEPITEFNEELEKLVADMWETMHAASGVGLAAPQIGISKSLCVIDLSSGENPASKLVLANPVIQSREGKQESEEGCLSLPDFRANTPRPETVTVRAQNLKGEEIILKGQGLLARAFAHEIDHLNGILYIKHLRMLKRESIKRQIRRQVKAGTW